MGKVIIKIFVVTLIFAFFYNSASATTKNNWKKIKEKKGIVVSSCPVKGSKFKMYKAEKIIEQQMEVLFEVMLDVKGYSEWMPDVEKATLIKMLDPERINGKLVVHVMFDAQWPVKNREVVVKAISDIDWNEGRSVITLNETLDYNIPLSKGRLRVEKFYAVFDFQYIDRKHTSVTYTTHAEPGGLVPAGIAKIQTATIPYKTLRNLEKVAKNPIYFKQAMRDYY